MFRKVAFEEGLTPVPRAIVSAAECRIQCRMRFVRKAMTRQSARSEQNRSRS
jgi:hypothetical protein